jgi:hypothetical protein
LVLSNNRRAQDKYIPEHIPSVGSQEKSQE